MDTQHVEQEIKSIIVDRLDLDDISADDIGTEIPLFDDDNDGLGLDSVESLELIIGVEQAFKVTVGEDEEVKNHFFSVKTLASYVLALQATES